ncbi:cro/CI family transcriptional regulator [Firmicutes bacterium CAG:95]|nr:cro/CI family transcriptional regulator [Firmicutes bacterium CAG:95]
MMNIRLKEIRKKRNLTQVQVSELLGCSTTVYSRYETGDRQPSIEILISLSQIFDVSIDYIVNNPWRKNNSNSDVKKSISEFDLNLIQSFHNADHYDQVSVMRTLNITEKIDTVLNA